MMDNTKPVILIVDDEPNIRQGMRWALDRHGAEILDCADGEAALAVLRSRSINLLLTDLRMPRMDGSALVAIVRREFPALPVIIITGHGSIESAVEALKNGVSDYMLKPVSIDELTIKVNKVLAVGERERKIEHLQERVEEMQQRVDAKYGFPAIVGNSIAMQQVFDHVRTVAPTRASVLIYGESGTGKEMIAEAIHQNSPRKTYPFVKVNCGALPLTLLESELFGHEAGSFTGAIAQRKGRFELADGGTVFLDEISETAPEFQVKLLRVLQEGTFERVGGTETVKCDVRVIAAGNRRLSDLVAQGKFREDLYYRLKVVELTLPPLRERRDDIPLLVDRFLDEFAKLYNRQKPAVTPKAMQALERAPWPGNVRQLRNVIESLMVMNPAHTFDLKHLPEEITGNPSHQPLPGIHIPIGYTMAQVEREIILATLRASGNNRTRTADILGIGRKTLYRKLDEYGLEQDLNPTHV